MCSEWRVYLSFLCICGGSVCIVGAYGGWSGRIVPKPFDWTLARWRGRVLAWRGVLNMADLSQDYSFL